MSLFLSFLQFFLNSIRSTLTSSPINWYTYVITVLFWMSISTKEGVTVSAASA